jgi:hypothetical protein
VGILESVIRAHHRPYHHEVPLGSRDGGSRLSSYLVQSHHSRHSASRASRLDDGMFCSGRPDLDGPPCIRSLATSTTPSYMERPLRWVRHVTGGSRPYRFAWTAGFPTSLPNRSLPGNLQPAPGSTNSNLEIKVMRVRKPIIHGDSLQIERV